MPSSSALNLYRQNHSSELSFLVSLVIEGKISSGHARTIITIEDKDKQYMIAQKIFDEKLSVRDVEKLMKASYLTIPTF